MINMKPVAVLLIATCLVRPALAAPDAAMRDLSIVQAEAVNVGVEQPGTLKVATSFDRANLAYASGETVRMFVTSNEDAFVTVYTIGPSGSVTQLFPNKFQPGNAVKANQPVEVGTGGAKILVSPPVGVELIKVFASSKPFKINPDGQMAQRGAFASLNGGVHQLSRNLAVDVVDTDMRLAIDNRAIRTVLTAAEVAAIQVPVPPEPAAPPAVAPAPERPKTPDKPDQPEGKLPDAPAPVAETPAAPAPKPPEPLVVAAIDPPPPAKPVASAADPAAFDLVLDGKNNPFALVIGTDRSDYALGEPVTLAVTPLQNCYLNVFELDGKGRVRILFPNQAAQNNLVGMQQAVVIGAAGSAAQVMENGESGKRQFVAACSDDPAQVSSTAYDFGRSFTDAGMAATLAADLRAAFVRSGTATALSSVNISVHN